MRSSARYLLIAQLLYGTGMRITECLRLRVMDIDFDQMQIRVWNSKGNKSRYVPLPRSLVPTLNSLLKWREGLHEQDLATGEASVWLPDALDRKYPGAHREFKWQHQEYATIVTRRCRAWLRMGNPNVKHIMQEHIRKSAKLRMRMS